MPEQYIRVERDEPIAVAIINRPEKLNALNWALVAELADALDALDHDEAIRCIVLTGAGDRAFAAATDIGEMSDKTPMSGSSTVHWSPVRSIVAASSYWMQLTTHV